MDSRPSLHPPTPSARAAEEGGGMSSGPPPPLAAARRLPLLKQRSWSPDSDRDEAWIRRKGIHRGRRGRLAAGRSVTDEDLDELRGCIDLGFGFDEADEGGDAGKKLSETFPALDLYYAVNRSYRSSVGGSSPSVSSDGGGDASPVGSPLSILTPGDDPEMVKARLKQWAQVVACAVRQGR